MSQPHMPQGCYSVKFAAEKLGIRESNLLKKMRLRGWLYKGIFRKDPLTDMPLPDAIEQGFVKRIKRNFHAPYDWEIAITKKGLAELGGKMQNQPQPTPPPLTLENAQRAQTNKSPTTTCEEHEKCIKELAEMGLYFSKAC